MEFPKQIEIELLKCYQKLYKIKAPDFWAYTHEWAEKYKRFWGVSGAHFFCGTPYQFFQVLDLMEKQEPEFKGRRSNALWVFKNLKFDASTFAHHRFVITPDGQTFVLQSGSCFYQTATKMEDGSPWEAAFRYLTDRHDDEDDEYRRPEWAETSDLLETLETKHFKPAFDKAWKQWVKDRKADGSWQAAIKNRQNRRVIQKTNKKIAVCLKTKEVIDELQSYLVDLNKGTATQRQVARLYYIMTKLGSLNKKFKGSLPKGD